MQLSWMDLTFPVEVLFLMSNKFTAVEESDNGLYFQKFNFFAQIL